MCLLSPACLAADLQAVFAMDAEDDPETEPIIVSGESSRLASTGLFVATFPDAYFNDGHSATVRLAMNTAKPGVGCAPRTFHLPAVASGEGDALRAVLFSDSQSGAPVFRTLLQQASDLQDDGGSGHEWDLIVHLGDTTQDPKDEREAVAYFLAPLESFYTAVLSRHAETTGARAGDGSTIHRPRVPPVLLVRGNHDSLWSLAYNGHRLDPENSPADTDAAYFVVKTGPVRWIVLDAVTSSIAAQAAWLRAVCAQNHDQHMSLDQGTRRPPCRRSWTVVLVHIPPFIEFWDREAWFNRSESTWGAQVRTTFLPLLEGCNVDALVSGHSHVYQRGVLDNPGSAGWPRIPLVAVTGGAGGALENVKDQVATWGIYATTTARHHFVALSTTAAPVLGAWEGSEQLEATAKCRRPLAWEAWGLGSSTPFDSVVLQPPSEF